MFEPAPVRYIQLSYTLLPQLHSALLRQPVQSRELERHRYTRQSHRGSDLARLGLDLDPARLSLEIAGLPPRRLPSRFEVSTQALAQGRISLLIRRHIDRRHYSALWNLPASLHLLLLIASAPVEMGRQFEGSRYYSQKPRHLPRQDFHLSVLRPGRLEFHKAVTC